MTPEQITLVQSSYAALGRDPRHVAERFYERLFARDPSLRTMFSSDPDEQGSLFATELGMIVRCISTFEAFVGRARGLGARHLAYGVSYDHYALAGGVLLDALADALGPTFTEETRTAWRLAFDLVAETMMQGAAEVP